MFSSGANDGVVRQNYWIQHAYNVIEDTYGDVVRVKPKNLLKFGLNANADSGVATTVMTLAGAETNETYVSANTITHFASSSGADDQELVVEGHTISGSNLTFVSQTVTLNGQTKTALTTPLARCTRAYNNDTTAIAGTVYFAQDVTFTSGVPQTNNAVHLIIKAGAQQSEKCATAFSSQDYGIITSVYANGERGNATTNFDMKLEIREFGKVFRPAFEWQVRSGAGTAPIFLNPYVIVPKNADVRIRATSDTDNATVVAWFNSVIALVQS